MGYDRIRYFEGADSESTLISATGASDAVVYGGQFSTFARHLGFSVRRIVDVRAVPEKKYLQNLVNRPSYGADLAEFPDRARRVWFGDPLAEYAVELRPPVSDETMRLLNAFLLTMCDPNDAGLILDNRTAQERTIAGY